MTEPFERVRVAPRSDGGWAVEVRYDVQESWDTMPRRFPSREIAEAFIRDAFIRAVREDAV